MKAIVYGTLKKDYGADLGEWGFKNTKIRDIVMDGYEMYSNGGYPMVIEGVGSIHAELWEIDPDCLEELDSYEGHPHLFKRITVEVGEYPAQMYLFNNEVDHYPRLLSGKF